MTNLKSKFASAQEFGGKVDNPVLYKVNHKEFRGIFYVEDRGMFSVEATGYGNLDAEMQELKNKFPGRRVTFMGVAEVVK